MNQQLRQRHDVRQSQILQAVGKLIITKGMDSVTMHDIAAEVGVSEAALYRHFTNKRAILLLLLDRWEETLLSTVRGGKFFRIPVLDNLERAFWAQLGDVEDYKSLSFIIMVEAIALEGISGLSARVAEILTNYLDAIKKILQRGIYEGVIREDINVEAAATIYFGMIQSTATLWALNDYTPSLAEHRTQMWQIFRRGVMGTSPTPLAEQKEMGARTLG